MVRLIPINAWLEAEHHKGMKDPEYVADWLSLQLSVKMAQVMTKEGLTRRAIAQRLGVSPAYVSKVLGGHPNMTLRSLTKFAMALGLRPAVTFEKPIETVARSVAPTAPTGAKRIRTGAISSEQKKTAPLRVAEGRAPYLVSPTSRQKAKPA